uniref:Uncharacterized protein n=1 Tax=Cucumis melo TaxID=3656 RepID=A0A9I9EAX3_CUCME
MDFEKGKRKASMEVDPLEEQHNGADTKLSPNVNRDRELYLGNILGVKVFSDLSRYLGLIAKVAHVINDEEWNVNELRKWLDEDDIMTVLGILQKKMASPLLLLQCQGNMMEEDGVGGAAIAHISNCTYSFLRSMGQIDQNLLVSNICNLVGFRKMRKLLVIKSQVHATKNIKLIIKKICSNNVLSFSPLSHHRRFVSE